MARSGAHAEAGSLRPRSGVHALSAKWTVFAPDAEVVYVLSVKWTVFAPALLPCAWECRVMWWW